jgi:hypothetical protein
MKRFEGNPHTWMREGIMTSKRSPKMRHSTGSAVRFGILPGLLLMVAASFITPAQAATVRSQPAGKADHVQSQEGPETAAGETKAAKKGIFGKLKGAGKSVSKGMFKAVTSNTARAIGGQALAMTTGVRVPIPMKGEKADVPATLGSAAKVRGNARASSTRRQ